MATAANPSALAAQARRVYVEALLLGVPATVKAVVQGAQRLAAERAEPQTAHKRQNTAMDLLKPAPFWQQGLLDALSAGPNVPLAARSPASSTAGLRSTDYGGTDLNSLQLVDDDTIEVEILSSRLALAMMDKASWEFTDLRARMSSLEKREELDGADVLRPHVVARTVIETWRAAQLPLEHWRTIQAVLHAAFGELVEEAYHETNRWLMSEGVRPEIDLRPLIRRSGGVSASAIPVTTGFGDLGGDGHGGGRRANVAVAPPSGGDVSEETRLMTRVSGLSRSVGHAEAVLGRLNKLVNRQVPQFADTLHPTAPTSAGLRRAISEAQTGLQQFTTTGRDRGPVSGPQLVQELQQRKQALKQAASTPVERATIEIVALLFQSILMEEKIPATVRVWFARLQMPVLRVAIGEPDFFAATDHPARKLIDRMGACVMGFDVGSRAAGDALDKEIKRVVQVVEAYPDTGRRVFQTVLTEFEKFLEHYFRNENEATRKGVSLAQQVEQRETMAIQYTIELRKMLNEVPVQEGVRGFLFHVWADVLATTALKHGAASDATKAMKRAATDLIWSAGAKVSREERADVLRRLPPLLKTLREGMAGAGLPQDKQDEHIQSLNDSLAAAFTAKAAAIPAERLDELMARLEDLEEMLPDADDLQIDESIVMDLSGHESTELQIVTEGGSMPTPAMMAWARELQVGGWYMLEHRGAIEPVQLAWQGMRRQLSLFVSQHGRGTLFQQHRLASFLQAGLLVPAQDEALTVRATRSALAKLDADPERLLG